MKLALVAAGLFVVQGMPASARCVVLAGTADGFDKETAVRRAQLALDDYIKQYKAENHLGAVTVKAMPAEPQPYWRGRVSENMMYRPDIVTPYTVCWQGVVSTYVCTSGAQVCS
jgi:soluble lytic murein transglycosylase-like protein